MDINKENIRKEIYDVIVEELGVAASEVTPDASFVDKLGAEPLDIMNIIMQLEEIWDFSIQDEEVEKIVTVEDLVKTVFEAISTQGQ